MPPLTYLQESFSKFHKSHWTYALWLLVISIATFCSYFHFAPINDFINEFFPGRYFMIDSIRNGHFPLWCPYQSIGIPIHADPQAGVFYLPAWLFAIFGPYTSVCCAIEYIFHVFMGGVGFYFLSHFFTKDKNAAFIISICYMLSGFFIGNAQHLSWIIAGAWLPWVLWGCLLLFEEPTLKASIILALSASLMLTGGYPGFLFILIYLIILLIIWYLIKYRNNVQQLKRILLFGIMAGVLLVMLSFPALYSFVEAKMYITRGEAVGTARISCPLTFQSLLSFFFPFTVCSSPDFIKTDISMASVFVGIFTPILFLIGCKNVKNNVLWLIGAFGIFSFLCAFGDALPFHRLAFRFLPLINFIQIASIFRIFFIIPVLLIAAYGLTAILQNLEKYRKWLIIMTVIELLALIAMAIILLLFKSANFNFDNWLGGAVSQKIFVECLIGAGLSAALLICLILLKSKKTALYLAIIMMANMIIGANFCAPMTVRDVKKTHKDLAAVTTVQHYPVPDSLKTPEKIIQEKGWYSIWMNAGCFAKEVEWYSWNPFRMSAQREMTNFYSEHDQTLNLPIAFCPRTLLCDNAATFLNSDTAYVSTRDESASYNEKSVVRIRIFEPNRMVLESSGEEAHTIALCQNYYPGWKAYAKNGEQLNINIINRFMMAVKVPSGQQEVTFIYHRPLLIATFFVEIFAFLACLFALILRKKRIFAGFFQDKLNQPTHASKRTSNLHTRRSGL